MMNVLLINEYMRKPKMKGNIDVYRKCELQLMRRATA